MKKSVLKLLAVSICLTIVALTFSAQAGPVKTSQHDSFKPEDFEKIAVIVKPIQSQQRSFGTGRHAETQSALERLVEQNFMRVMISNHYTLVSRADLDQQMFERGLDQNNMTDEKYSEEAAKILHVSAIMVVSVDTFGVKSATARVQNYNSKTPSMGETKTYYQVTAAISARLIKISDNMVMWTGDYSLSTNVNNENEANLTLGIMAEAIAKLFPAFKKQ